MPDVTTAAPNHASGALRRARPEGPHPVRRAADRQSPPRQLSRRDPQLRAPAARLRMPLLRGRPARHHPAAGSQAAGGADPRDRRGLPGRRRRRQEADHLRPVDGAGARPARLGVQLRGPPRLDEPHDPVQGEGRQGPRERLARPLRLSGADGGRHPDLQGHPRAGRRGPEAAPRADARHRHQVQQRLQRAGLLPDHRAADLRRRDAGHEPARRHQEDEQVRSVGLFAHQPDRRRRRHRPEDPPRQDRSAADAGHRGGRREAARRRQPAWASMPRWPTARRPSRARIRRQAVLRVQGGADRARGGQAGADRRGDAAADEGPRPCRRRVARRRRSAPARSPRRSWRRSTGRWDS